MIMYSFTNEGILGDADEKITSCTLSHFAMAHCEFDEK